MKKIPLTRPFMNQEIKDRVCSVLDSGFLTEGPVTAELEKAFEEYVGCAHAIAVTSCTTGLEMALRALGIGPGDEVIVPDYTYPATADVVAIVGAKIVLVDVSPETMLIDYDQAEKAITTRTKAILPVSCFGNPLDYDRLNALKQKNGVFIVEDAACSLGADYKGIKVGNLADISVFSLHPRKTITTGEGGMITTNNPEWADWMRSYKHFGMISSATRSESLFGRIGTNYKLSDILAAVGVIQLRAADRLLQRRTALARNYESLLDSKRITIPKTSQHGVHAYQSFCIFIKDRDRILLQMREKGIEVQIGTYSLHMHPVFKESSLCHQTCGMPESKSVYLHCLALPLYFELTESDQSLVVDTLLYLMD